MNISDRYREIEDILNDVPRFTRKNSFEDTLRFYDYIQSLGFTEERLGNIIHVAGTNGKGSVCAYLDSIYRESGYKVAMFTSPHLITTRERFRINGENVSEEIFIESYEWLEEVTGNYQKIGDYIPTYFERLFFMMMYIFTKSDVDITILETGLGGLLDTTNTIRHPILCIITEIGLDHMAYLGNTYAEIATQKAGIIKKGAPLVFADKRQESSQVFIEKSLQNGISYHKVSTKDCIIKEIHKKYIDFSAYSSYYKKVEDYRIYTTALYQVENAAIAIKAVEVLLEMGELDHVSKESLKAGISGMRWAGRMEEIMDGVYIDGAHNEDGIDAFVTSLKHQDLDVDRCFLIFSAVNDKKYDKMIQKVAGIDKVTDFVVTRIPGHRGVDIESLGIEFERYSSKPIHIFDEIQEAFSYCMREKGDKDVVYIVGSLYLAGIVEDIVKGINRP